MHHMIVIFLLEIQPRISQLECFDICLVKNKRVRSTFEFSALQNSGTVELCVI